MGGGLCLPPPPQTATRPGPPEHTADLLLGRQVPPFGFTFSLSLFASLTALNFGDLGLPPSPGAQLLAVPPAPSTPLLLHRGSPAPTARGCRGDRALLSGPRPRGSQTRRGQGSDPSPLPPAPCSRRSRPAPWTHFCSGTDSSWAVAARDTQRSSTTQRGPPGPSGEEAGEAGGHGPQAGPDHGVPSGETVSLELITGAPECWVCEGLNWEA